MTDDSNKISNSAPSPDTELWLSQTELAEMKGVTRQTIWEKVTRLEQDGLLATRPGPHGTKLVPVAEYDRLVGETTDFARQKAPRPELWKPPAQTLPCPPATCASLMPSGARCSTRRD